VSTNDNLPVIIGVGQINDRPVDEGVSMNPVELMAAALRAADADAGGGWLARAESLETVAQISFPDIPDASRPLAEALDIAPRHIAQTPYPTGDGPVRLLNEAANRIAAGELSIALIAGAEALRTGAKRAAGARDALRASSARRASDVRQRYGIVAPTDVYPFYENACRAAWGQTLAEAQAETAEIWSALSRVAADSSGAWLRTPLTPAQILEVSPQNRMIAFPYTKLMVANSSVNQGAAFIVTSLARAKAAGVPEARLVYVGRGAAAREQLDVMLRDRINRSTSMEATLRNTLAFNGLASGDLDHVELYSCFPCVPKMARRMINWPLNKPMSVFGGLTFGGAPVGNYMSHAVAAMVDKMRAGGRHGLLFGNGGFATTNHAIIVSRDPAIALRAPHSFDVQAEAEAQRDPAPILVETYSGPGTIETYTIFYDRDGAAKNGVVVGLNPAGERFVAQVAGDDAAMIDFLASGKTEAIGAGGLSRQHGDLNRWSFA